jgi:small subunit ribosomal protein S13
MPRIVGIDLPKDKRVDVGLRYIYGVGRYTASILLSKAGVKPDIRCKDLTEDQVTRITQLIQKDVVYEGNLRRELGVNIKRLMDIGSYRGGRHKRGLPVRGQRTKTNARIRKGPKKTIGAKTAAKV